MHKTTEIQCFITIAFMRTHYFPSCLCQK